MIENPSLSLNTSDVVRNIETPGFGNSFNKTYYEIGHSYISFLLFPKDLAEQIGNGSLVIHVDVFTREEEGWQEEVQVYMSDAVGETKFKLYYDSKNWEEAEAHCLSEGGHLASIKTEKEYSELLSITDGKNVWIGGKRQDKDGRLSWYDGQRWV